MRERVLDRKTEIALTNYTDLVRAIDSTAALLENQASVFGLTLNQFQALLAILQLGPMSQAGLSGELFLAESTMMVIIRNIEARLKVTRKVDDDDGRKLKVELTSEGKKLVAKIFPQHAKLIRAQMAALGTGEQGNSQDACARKLRAGDPLKFVLGDYDGGRR